MHSSVLAKKDQPFCTSLYHLCASILISPAPGWILLEWSSLFQSSSSANLALSSHICLAVVPNSWDYEEVPLPRVSADTDCHPTPSQVPLAQVHPRCRAALHELWGAFPRTLILLGPKRGDSFAWGSWFPAGLYWFRCFKIDVVVQWCLWGRWGKNFRVRLGWMRQLNISLFFFFFCFAIVTACHCLDIKMPKMI